VVVPFYNLADVLRDCLQSIATQTFRDLEVIMVDDGSTDGSAAIARAQADADDRFHLIQVPNGGPGYARNRGIERAHGEFLAFVDGDDMLPRGAYETLLDTLRKSGSDFVSGNVYRFGPWGIMPSGMHARAIKGRRIGTHITRSPQLLYDMTIWNKLYRKDFWDQRRLRFPEGVVYEDVQLATQAHVLARAVDVIPDFVYDWRHRGKGTFSITQSRTDIANLRDRLGALLANDRFLAKYGPEKLLRRHQRKALGNDIWLYAGELTRTGDDYRAEFLDMVNSYLDQVRPRVLAKLTAAQKLAYYLIRERMLPELLEFLAWLEEEPRGIVPVVRSFGKLRADLPFRGDQRLGIPGKVYRPYWRELDPFVRVEQIGWAGGTRPGGFTAANQKMTISGRAYIPSVDITKRRHTSKIVILRPRGRLRPPLVLRARSFRHPDATALSGQERYSYEWAGFRFELGPRLLRLAGRWLTGDWECYLLVRGHTVWREYYFNDAGNQIRLLGESVRARARGKEVPDGGYRGEYVAELAAEIPGAAELPGPELAARSVELMLGRVKASLERYRVHYDQFFSERTLHEGSPSALERTLTLLEQRDHVYRSEGALWLRTTSFGDDKDRVVVRSNGDPTYLAADVAYLEEKRERGYDRQLIPVGSDHHAYARELRAAMAALGGDPDTVEVPILQFVHLVHEGDVLAMSKRRGDFVTLDDLLDAIGVDATRFFMLRSSHDRTLELDLELARRQSADNPVYYVQYAHARIASMLAKLPGQRVTDAAQARDWGVEGLHPSERDLIKKLAAFPEEIAEAAERLAPHRMTQYSLELARQFTTFYEACRVIGATPTQTESFRVALSVATQRTIALALGLLGVSAPDSM